MTDSLPHHMPHFLLFCALSHCLVPHPLLFSIVLAYMFLYKKNVLDEADELIQWYTPLKDICTDLLEKWSAHQDSLGT